MQYMLLIYQTEGTVPQPGSPEFHAFMNGYMDVTGEAKGAGIMGAGDALQGISTATTVRGRDGKTEATDGPFAETKEQLGGFYLLDCKDLDEAISYAAKIPSANHGSIEIRPAVVWD
jgi:hypothetical protein